MIGYLVALNIIVNSFLAFFTAALLVEVVVRIFRIAHPRYLAMLKMIPLLKLPIALMLINWSFWAIGNEMYPWEWPEGSRILSACCSFGAEKWYLPPWIMMGFSLSNGYLFSVADLAWYLMGNHLVRIFVGLFGVVTIGKWAVVFSRVMRAHREKKKMLSECTLLFKRENVEVMVHPSLFASPFVIGRTIVFPKDLELKDEEFEAVIAHEMEHVRWKDSLSRGILAFIRSLFWWIPTRWLARSVEEKQEIACDGPELASALIKVAKRSQTHRVAPGIPLYRSKLRKRIEAMGRKGLKNRWVERVLFAITLIFGISILLGKLWEI